MDGIQGEPQSSPSSLSGEGKHPPPSSGRQFCSQPPAPATAFWIFPFVQEKTGAGGEKAPLGRFLLQCKDEEKLHELPLRWNTPCSLDDCWSRENQARLVFLLLPSSLLHPPERVCSRGEWARTGSPLGLLSCLIPPWLSLQLGPGASDLHPSSPKTSSSTKPSPRQRRKRNPPNAALHLVCALLPVPSRRCAAGFRSRCRSSPPTSLSVMHLFGLYFCHLKKKLLQQEEGWLATSYTTAPWSAPSWILSTRL